MQPHEIKCAVVTRMYRDGIVEGRQYADVKTVAEQAVPPSAVQDARDEIEDHMIDDADCPVVMVRRDVVTLRNDEKQLRAYLTRYCGARDDDWPADLRRL